MHLGLPSGVKVCAHPDCENIIDDSRRFCSQVCANKFNAFKNGIPWNTGLTKETDERVAKNGIAISAALTDVPKSSEHKMALSIALMGRSLSSEHCTAISVCKTGKPRPDIAGDKHPMKRPEVVAKVSGDKNWNWMGGVSLYPLKFTRSLKEVIRERDNYVCQFCGKTTKENGRRLDIHHIDYNKENLEHGNLISLCRTCHAKTNCDRSYWQKKFNRIIEKV